MVKTDFKESHHRFDQCGVVMYLDSENWLKGSIEYENDNFQHLGSVVTNNGYSDWATTEIDAEIKSMWYRLSRREDDYCIECSEDGIRFKQMRICHMSVSYTHLRAHETSLHLVCRLLLEKKIFLMIRRPPRSTHCISSAASDVYKRQVWIQSTAGHEEPCGKSGGPPSKPCLLYTSPSPRDLSTSRMPSSA